MASFEDLGLREELLRTLEDEDIEAPTAFQAAAIPVLRRGGNLVARASTGAGKTLAYSLGVLDRLKPREAGEDDESIPVRALVLVPTGGEAERVALAMFPYAQAAEMSVTSSGGTWATPVTQAEVVVATPAAVLAAVRSSELKLDELEAIVIDGAAIIQELGSLGAIDTLLDNIPRDAQRILLTSAVTPELDDLIDRRVKRALRYPPEPAVPDAVPAAPVGEIGYVLVPERDKLEIVARVLAQPRGDAAPPVLHCRTDERAALVAEALTVRGFLVGELDDPDTDIVIAAADTGREELASDTGEEPGRSISYDVPADAATLLSRHRGDPGAVVLIEPRELPHLQEIARQARLATHGVPRPPAANEDDEIDRFREQLRRALRDEDLGAQLLVLEPLFDEFDPSEIAAAAAALLRRRQPPTVSAAPTAPAQTAASVTSVVASAPSPQTETGPPPATWARLYVGIGDRDGIRKGDLVGAIAGEANIPGSRIGKIDVRDTFSIVEIQADVAEQVIRAVNGTTIKGRSVRVDYDRGGDRARKSPERGPGGAPGRRPREGGPPAGRARPPVRRPPRDRE